MTGYTYELVDKKLTFEQFAMQCARAFGALITMRDESMDADIPDEFPPSDYHPKEKAKAQEELARLQSLSTESAIEEEKADVAKLIESFERGNSEDKEKREFMRRTLIEVQKWTPPTLDHVGLKGLMIEQIETSLKGGDWYEKEISRLKSVNSVDIARMARDRIVKAERDIAYHTEEYAKECERCEERTKWVRDLRASFK